MESNPKHAPKDTQVIKAMMKDLGITEYEPQVINQLMEVAYRHITGILEDAKVYANHKERNKPIELEDVQLAAQMQSQKTFTNPPPRDVLIDLATAKNNIPLPVVKPSYGLRLPPDRYCLNATNYQLKTNFDNTGKSAVSEGNGAVDQSTVKMEPGTSGLSIVKRADTLAKLDRKQIFSIPKPVFKVSAGTSSDPPATKKQQPPKRSKQYNGLNLPQLLTETEDARKRKRDEEDYYTL